MFDPAFLARDGGRFAKTVLTTLFPDLIPSIDDISAIKGINGGVQNLNYHVTLTNGQAYFFSVLRPEHGQTIDAQRLKGCTSFLHHASQRGVLCPTPLAGADNQFFHKVEALEGKPYAILYRWLPGTDLETATIDDAASAARSLAQWAIAGQSFDASEMGSPLTIPSLKESFLTNLGLPADTDLSSLSHDHAAIQQAALNLREKATKAEGTSQQIILQLAKRLETDLVPIVVEELTALDKKLPEFAQLPRTMCHKDLHAGNLLSTDQGLAILDPDWIGRDIAVYDLGMMLAFWTLQPPAPYHFDANMAKTLISEYDKVRPLSAEEKEALPDMVRAGATRFFMRRFMNVMTADPANIRKSPEEFMERLQAFPYDTFPALIAEATTLTQERKQHYHIARTHQAFSTTHSYRILVNTPALADTANAFHQAFNAAREAVSTKNAEPLQTICQSIKHSVLAGSQCEKFIKQSLLTQISELQQIIQPSRSLTRL